MSAAYGLRSYGQPYFCAQVANLNNMDAATCIAEHNDGGSSFGSLSMEFEFMLHSLPVKLSSDDELHPLFAYADHYPSGVGDMAALGVTPNGRLAAQVMNAPQLQSQTGLVVPGRRYIASLQCNRSSLTEGVDAMLLIDALTTNVIYSPAGTIRPRNLISPVGDSRFILFNGEKATSRCACTIFRALTQGIDVNDNLVSAEWLIEDRKGNSLAWTPNPDLPPNVLPEDGVPMDFSMALAIHTPEFWSSIYGPPGDLASAFSWHYETEWAKRSKPETVWQKALA